MNKAIAIAIIISLATPVFSESSKQGLSQKAAQESVQVKLPVNDIQKEVITAKAYIDKGRKKPVYTEKHTAIYKNGKLETSDE